jgi:hypothetical protein
MRGFASGAGSKPDIAAAGIAVFNMSGCAAEARCDPALPLSCAALPEDEIEESVIRLGSALGI